MYILLQRNSLYIPTYCEIPVQPKRIFQDLESQFGNQYEERKKVLIKAEIHFQDNKLL